MKKVIHKLNILRLQLPGPSDWKIWFTLALILKTSFFLYTVLELEQPNIHYPETFASDGGDSSSYIDPIENLLAKGTYFDDYRMPGLGWLYFLLRLILPMGAAMNTLVCIQLILSALSVYILAKIAYKVFGQVNYFYSTFFLYAVSTFVSLYDPALLTESICTSSIIFAVYFMINQESNKWNLVLSGLFLTWTIFLRPVFAPLLFLFVIYVLVINKKPSFKLSSFNWRGIFLFIIPFLLIDGIWVVRNFQKYKAIYPLTKTLYYPGTEKSYLGSLFHFMNSYGGSIVFWEPGSDITFFKPAPDFIKKKKEISPPSYIYTSKFNYDSLVIVKRMIQELESQQTSPEHKLLLNNLVKKKLDGYTLSIRKEKPFLFYVTSRFRVFKTFFVHSGTYNLFNKASFELNKVELVVKIFYSLLYAFIILFGFIGCVWLLGKGFGNINYFFLSSIALYNALVFPFLLKLDEFRYFVPGYPFFLLSSIFVLINFRTLIIRKKLN